jgi:hypothetical protein
VPAAKPYCALEVGADVIMIGQRAPPSDLESRDPPRRKASRLSSLLSLEGPYKHHTKPIPHDQAECWMLVYAIAVGCLIERMVT